MQYMYRTTVNILNEMPWIIDNFHLTCIRQVLVKFVQQKVWKRLENESFTKIFIVFRKLQDTKKSIFIW